MEKHRDMEGEGKGNGHQTLATTEPGAVLPKIFLNMAHLLWNHSSYGTLILLQYLYIQYIYTDLLSRPSKKARDQDLGHQVSRPRPTVLYNLSYLQLQLQDLGHQVSRPRPRPW